MYPEMVWTGFVLLGNTGRSNNDEPSHFVKGGDFHEQSKD
jgi:hypothetical protein